MRKIIQSKLDETNIECGPIKPDNLLVENKTYFGYQTNNNYINTDSDSTYEMRANIIGYVTRIEKRTENTLQIVDDAVVEIINKLKELGFRTSHEDVSLDNGIRKIQITGNAVAQDEKLIGGI